MTSMRYPSTKGNDTTLAWASDAGMTPEGRKLARRLFGLIAAGAMLLYLFGY